MASSNLALSSRQSSLCVYVYTMQILFIDFGGAGKASLIWQEFEVEQDGTPYVIRSQKIASKEHKDWPSHLKADIKDVYSFARDIVSWATGTFEWTLTVIHLGITGDRIEDHSLTDVDPKPYGPKT